MKVIGDLTRSIFDRVVRNESLIAVGSRESGGEEEQAMRTDKGCGCKEEQRNGQQLEGDVRSRDKVFTYNFLALFFKVRETIVCLHSGGNEPLEREVDDAGDINSSSALV